MGYKTIDRSTDFTDFILKKSNYNNRYLNGLAGIDHAIGGSRTEAFLTVHDPVGTSNPGVGAEPGAVFNCRLKIRGNANFQTSQVWRKLGDIEIK